jgi:hypothetical protein
LKKTNLLSRFKKKSHELEPTLGAPFALVRSQTSIFLNAAARDVILAD